MSVLLLVTGIMVMLAVNLFIGSVNIPVGDVCDILIGKEDVKSSWRFIVMESRLPQAITAILCGAALSLSGLLLQTVFRNPLADPSVFGISSGAGLGVAVVTLLFGGSIVTSSFSLSGFMAVSLAAFLGAALVTFIILFVSSKVRNSILLVIIGIMIGYIASSAITMLNFFATEEGVKSYVVWGMGNFSGVTGEQLPYFALSVGVGLAIAILLIKPLNALLLGDRYAANLGVNIKLTRNLLLIVTGLLTASTTAFCGPISFIGLAVPHIARLLLGTSNHNTLLPVTLLCGAVTTLLCNLICILPGESGILPINAITPVLGAPVIIYVIINQRKIQYFN